MRTFGDLLVWYNNLDVLTFLEVLEKEGLLFASKGIEGAEGGVLQNLRFVVSTQSNEEIL